MTGATEYAKLFQTGQHGKLFFVSSSHARGRTFRIFVLPEKEMAIPNGLNSPPLNKDAVEVYGIITGMPGWSEEYGWLHQGKWCADFDAVVANRKLEIAEKEVAATEAHVNKEAERVAALLAAY